MENQHGLPQLVYDGYVMRRDRERSRLAMNVHGESVARIRTYWRCIIRTCRARGNVDPTGQLRLTHGHDHPRNEEKVKYHNLRAQIKKRALEFKHESPRDVLEHFKIRDESLEKTIVNWRYRYVRETRTVEDNLKTYLQETQVFLDEDDVDLVEVEEAIDIFSRLGELKKKSCSHRCPLCKTRSYVHRKNLISHMKYECGREPRFKCSMCPYAAKWKHNLKSHMFRIHPVILPGPSDQPYKFIQSKNGKYLLLLDGFAYRKYMTSKTNQSYWTCTLRGCRAKGSLSASGIFSLTKYNHNHEPDHAAMQRKEYVSQLRKLSLTTDWPVDRLLREVGIGLDSDPERKYRVMINFWRWHAKRKQESNLSSGYLEGLEYQYVKLENTHYLCYRNYLYRKYLSSKTNSGSFWRCRQPTCPSRLRIHFDGALHSMIFNHDHQEEAMEAELVDQDIRQQVRNAALTTDLSSTEILKMYDVEDDVEMKKYLKNLKARRGKKSEEKEIEEQGAIELLENVPGVVFKMPKDYLLQLEGDMSEDEPTVVQLDSYFKVVNIDVDGNEEEIVYQQATDEEDDEETKCDYATLYVASDKEDQTFVLNQ